MQAGKNKKVTYLLICAVGVVWGVILYKVFFNDTGMEDTFQPQIASPKNEPYDQYAAKTDTFKLALNYKDPFVGMVAAEQPEVVENVKSVNTVPLAVKPMVDWTGIKYSGYVVNPLTKKLVAILVVRGQERMLAEGEVFGGLKLLKNKKDSVLVSWQGKQKYIKQ